MTADSADLTAAPARTTRGSWVTGIYYVVGIAVMVIIVTKQIGNILPAGIASHVSDDSEGYVLALLLPPWIDYVRPRVAGRRSEWLVTGAAALVALAIALTMYLDTTMYGRIRTLNETFFALALVIPYVQLARRPSPRNGVLIGLGLIVLGFLLEATPAGSFITIIAEGVVMIVIAPFLFDVTDRGILDARRPSPLGLRVLGWVLLLVIPIAYIALRDIHSSITAVRLIAGYGVRAQEAFVGMFLIAMLYAVRGAVSRRGRERASR